MQVIPLGIINERVDTGLKGFIGLKSPVAILWGSFYSGPQSLDNSECGRSTL